MRKSSFTLFVILLLLTQNTTIANPHSIIEITYSPLFVETNTNVTISITFDDISNITKVGSFYCKIYPEYLCHIPAIAMINSGNTYSGSFIVTESAEENIGFDIFIDYEDGTRLTLPNDEQLNFCLPLAEPLENVFYYRINVGSTYNQDACGVTTDIPLSSFESTTSETLDNILFIFTYYIIAFVVVRRKLVANTNYGRK